MKEIPPPRRVRTPVALAALTAAAALLLAGCAPESDDAAPSPTASATASPSPVVTSPAPQPTTDPADPACVVGEWEMDQEDLTSYYDQINTLMEGSGASFSPAGRAGLSLRADGTFSWTPEVVVTADVAGSQISVTLGGSVDGSYTADDGAISTSDVSTENLSVSAATQDGAPTDAGPIGGEIGGAPLTGAAYSCSGDTLELTTTVTDSPVTTTLSRR